MYLRPGPEDRIAGPTNPHLDVGQSSHLAKARFPATHRRHDLMVRSPESSHAELTASPAPGSPHWHAIEMYRDKQRALPKHAAQPRTNVASKWHRAQGGAAPAERTPRPSPGSPPGHAIELRRGRQRAFAEARRPAPRGCYVEEVRSTGELRLQNSPPDPHRAAHPGMPS